MSEKSLGFEEYKFKIWRETLFSIKTAETRQSNNLDDQRKIIQTGSVFSTEHFLNERKKLRKFNLSPKQTQQLVTLFPDMVVSSSEDLLKKNINPFLGVLLFADISGFTALAGKCAGLNGSGVYKLTSIINDYLGKMVGMVYEYGGDVWKFSGDSFLAVWKVGIDDVFGYVIHRVLRCALDIQKTQSHYVTEFKIVLRVKVGMAGGNLIWSTVGNENSLRPVLVGTPVAEVQKAQVICQSGDVILAASLWNYISPVDCVHQILEGGKFVRVTYILGFMGLTDPSLMKLVGAPGAVGSRLDNFSKSEVRPPKQNLRENLGLDLRICLLELVMQQIDADLSLDYLTEMRNLTVIMVNIIPHNMVTTDLLKVVDRAYIAICRLVHRFGGFLEKISLFDKDVMFLAIFHEGRADSSLGCGYDVRESCLSIPGVQNVSVGITTGMAYFGVVGHPRRQEFTVIGPAVNKAARLMIVYANKVTCDSATRSASVSPDGLFRTVSYTTLKGFADEDIFFEFIGDKSNILDETLRSGMTPLLGRNNEMNIFRKLLEELDKTPQNSYGLVIEGESKIGKSRLLDEIVVESHRRGLQSVVVGLRWCHAMQPYGAAMHILCQVLGIPKELMTRELGKRLKHLLTDHMPPEQLTILEHLFEGFENNGKVLEIMKLIFIRSISLGTAAPLLVIDDVDFCDSWTWELIMAAAGARCKLLLLSMEPGRSELTIPSIAYAQLQKINLAALAPKWIIPLSCQLMRVDAVDFELSSFLQDRCDGNAGLCLQLLNFLKENSFAEVQKLDAGQIVDLELNWPASSLVTPVSTLVPALTPSAPPESYSNDQSSGDFWNDVYFEYYDHKEMIRVLDKQQWWSKNRSGIPEGSQLLKADNVEKEKRRATKNLEQIVQELCGPNEEIEYGSSFYIPSPDDGVIAESVEIFRKIKKKRNQCDGDGDLLLDELRKYQSDSKHLSSSSSILTDMEKKNSQKGVQSDVAFIHDPTTSVSKLENDRNINRQGSVLALLKVPGTNLKEIATPTSYVAILAVFDSLPAFDQMVLKCCAIFEGKFTRAILDAILNDKNAFYISLAIKLMFDLNIVACSSEPNQELLTLHRCSCELPPDSMPDFTLPSYAVCKNLEFRLSGFRSTLYNLLPPNQKRMFHQRAALFIASQPMLCSSCVENIESGVLLRPATSNKHRESLSKAKCSGAMLKLLEALLEGPMPDFNNCMCHLVKYDTLKQLITHCQSAGMPMLKLTHMNSLGRLQVAMGILDAARATVKTLQENIGVRMTGIGELTIVSLEWLRLLDWPRNTLPANSSTSCRPDNGEIAFEAGDLNAARDYILSTLRRLYPWVPTFNWRMWQLISCSKNFLNNRTAAKALSILTKIFMMKNKEKKAHRFCRLSMKIYQMLDDKTELCKCYGNLVDIALTSRGRLTDLDPEDRMITVATTMLPVRSLTEATALATLIHAIYTIKTLGEGDLNIGSMLLAGMESLAKSSALAPAQELVTLDLFHVLSLQGRVPDAATTLSHLRDGTDSQKFWFHALNLDFIRMTGYWIEKPSESVEYLMQAIKEGNQSSNGYLRGATVLKLWLLTTDPSRVNEIETPVVMGSHPAPMRSVADLMMRLEQLHIILLERYLLPKSSTLHPHLSRITRVWLAELTATGQNLRIILPLLLQFKAQNAAYNEGNRLRAQQMLVEMSKLALDQGADLITARIALLREMWRWGEDGLGAGSKTVSQALEWTEWRRHDWHLNMIPIIPQGYRKVHNSNINTI